MGNEVVKVVQQAGLVEKDTVAELQRWGSPIAVPPPGPEVPVEIAPVLIERAMQEQDFVQVRETDLEVLKQYLSTQEVGVLKLEDIRGNTERVDVMFGKTPHGEYIIPWIDEKITDLYSEHLVSLHVDDFGWVLLKDPRELYYGDRKVFTVWKVDQQ
jgi:hypothetical protein